MNRPLYTYRLTKAQAEAWLAKYEEPKPAKRKARATKESK